MSNINEQKEKALAELHKLEEMGGSLSLKAKHFRDSAFTKFPIVLVLMSTFGLVATLYGFEKVIDEIDFFSEHPIMILITGVVTLAITGSLYKRLR